MDITGIFNSISAGFSNLMKGISPKPTAKATPVKPAATAPATSGNLFEDLGTNLSKLSGSPEGGNLFSEVSKNLEETATGLKTAVKPAAPIKLTPTQEAISKMTPGQKIKATGEFVKSTAQGLAQAAVKFGVSAYQVPETLLSGGVAPEAVPVPKILQDVLGEKEISSYQRDTAKDIESGMSPLKAIGIHAGEVLLDAWAFSAIAEPIVNLTTRSLIKGLPENLFYKITESKLPVSEIMDALRGTGTPSKAVRDFINPLTNEERLKLNAIARAGERTGKPVVTAAVKKEPTEVGKFLGLEGEAKPTIPETRANKQLPGYTTEQKPAFGLSTEKVTPVGGAKEVKPVVGEEMRPLPEIRQDLLDNLENIKATGKSISEISRATDKGFIPKSGITKAQAELVAKHEALRQELVAAKGKETLPTEKTALGAGMGQKGGTVAVPRGVNDIIKQISESSSEEEVAGILRDIGIKEDLVPAAAKRMATMKDEDLLSQKLGGLMSKSGIEEIPERTGSLRLGAEGLEEIRLPAQPGPAEVRTPAQAEKTAQDIKSKAPEETQQKVVPLEVPKFAEGKIEDSLRDSIAHSDFPVTKKVNLLDYMKTPEKVLNKIGLGQQAQVLRESWDKFQADLQKDLKYLSGIRDTVPSKESSKNIFQWLDGKEVKLTPKEKDAALHIKGYLEHWAVKLGLPSEARITNYITHIFERGVVEKEFDPELAKLIDSKVPASVYDPFLMKRSGMLGYQEDVWKALDAYTKRADRKFNMDPALRQLSSAADMLDNESFKYIKKYSDKINLRPSEIDNLLDNLIKSSPVGYRLGQRPTNVITGAIRKGIYRSTLGLNLSSALRNLTQGVNTYAVIGEKWTALGYMEFAKKATTKNLGELFDNGILSDEISMESRLGIVQNFWRKLDDILFFFFENVEKINRGAAYFGAKGKGIEMGLTEDKAIQYAKNVVRQTQFTFGQIDTPVALGSDIVKTLATLQTYNIKQIEFLASMAKDKDFAGLLRYIGASLAVFLSLGKLFSMNLTDMIPSMRLGGSPVGTVVTATDAFSTSPQKKAAGMKAAQKIPMYTVPASFQFMRSYNGLTDYMNGFSASASGKVKYTIPQDVGSFIRAVLFGSNTLPDAQAYYDALSSAGTAGETQAQAEDEYRRLKDLPADEAAKEFSGLISDNPAMAKAINKIIEDERLGITPQERMMANMAVANGQRAKYIAEQISQLPTDEAKGKYWQNLVDKKIITKQVATQLTDTLSGKDSPVSEGSHTSQGIVDTVVTYAKAIGTDPVTAFNRIFTGQRIVRVDGDAVIVERMPLQASEAVKKERGATVNMRLDHTIPLELGGGNDKGNLRLVPTDTWASYTPVENYLGKQLKAGKITKAQAQDQITKFKSGELHINDIIK